MMKEIFNRGPIACNVDATKILNYTTGIVTAKQLDKSNCRPRRGQLLLLSFVRDEMARRRQHCQHDGVLSFFYMEIEGDSSTRRSCTTSSALLRDLHFLGEAVIRSTMTATKEHRD